MKVHLIKSQELVPDRYWRVVKLLEKYNGPISFISAEPFANESISHYVPATWDEHLEKCRKYRDAYFVDNDDLVILLTSRPNFPNWFIGFSEFPHNDFFVHSDDWDLFVDCEQFYPIAFQIALIPIRKQMFGHYQFAKEYFHHPTRGCVQDLCKNKLEIIFKFRTADFCSECIEIVKKTNVSNDLFNQISEILEDIRPNFLSKTKIEPDKKPSRLKVTDDRVNNILLTDLNNLKIPFSPLEKVVFLIYLKYPEGLTVHEFCERKKEIAYVYRKLSNTDDPTIIRDRIDNLTNPLSNSLSEKISRIKQILKKLIGDELAQHYIISGPNAEKKMISLDRSLVDWESKIL